MIPRVQKSFTLYAGGAYPPAVVFWVSARPNKSVDAALDDAFGNGTLVREFGFFQQDLLHE